MINAYLSHVLGLPVSHGFFYPNYTSIHRVAAYRNRASQRGHGQSDGALAWDRPSHGSDAAVMTSLADLIAFLDASPSPWHTAESAADRLLAAGFHEVRLDDPWSVAPSATHAPAVPHS